jgi:hypothetical protein
VKDNDKKLFSDVDPQTVTSYNEVDPKIGHDRVPTARQEDVLLTVPNMTFEPGQHYTIVIAVRPRHPEPRNNQNIRQAQHRNGDVYSFAVIECNDEEIVVSDIRGRNVDDYAEL